MSSKQEYYNIILSIRHIKEAFHNCIIDKGILKENIQNCIKQYLESDIMTDRQKVFATLRFSVDVYTYLRMFRRDFSEQVIFHCGANHARRIYCLIMNTGQTTYYTNFGRFTYEPPLRLEFYKLFQPPFKEPSQEETNKSRERAFQMKNYQEIQSVMSIDDKSFMACAYPSAELREKWTERDNLKKEILKLKYSGHKVKRKQYKSKRKQEELELSIIKLQKSFFDRHVIMLNLQLEYLNSIIGHMDERERYTCKHNFLKLLTGSPKILVIHTLLNDYPNSRKVRELIGLVLSLTCEKEGRFNSENLTFMTPEGMHILLVHYVDVVNVLCPRGITFKGTIVPRLKSFSFSDSDIYALTNAVSVNMDMAEKNVTQKLGGILMQNMFVP